MPLFPGWESITSEGLFSDRRIDPLHQIRFAISAKRHLSFTVSVCKQLSTKEQIAQAIKLLRDNATNSTLWPADDENVRQFFLRGG